MVASGRLKTSVPLLCKVKATFGCTKAMRSNSVRILLSSVAFDLRNFLLAGTLKKRFFTVKLLPLGQETVSCDINFEPDITNRVPNSSSSIRVLSSTSATAVTGTLTHYSETHCYHCYRNNQHSLENLRLHSLILFNDY